jgi:1-acyl-sn-glycerol-3-phosphate acyltransferase
LDSKDAGEGSAVPAARTAPAAAPDSTPAATESVPVAPESTPAESSEATAPPPADATHAAPAESPHEAVKEHQQPLPADTPPTHFPEWPFHPVSVFVRRLAHLVVFFPILRWFNPLYVHGRENIDKLEGPFIFVANHSSHLDTPALMRAMPAPIRRRMTAAAAADYFFTSYIRGFFACLVCNAFPFPRKGREGINRAKWLLHNGWHLMLYPEGTRSKDGSISKFRPGVGLIAAESGATVVPVALLGMGRVLPKGSPLPKRAPVEVRIGEGMKFSHGDDPIQVTQQIEEAVRRLAAPEGSDLAPGRVRKR